MLRKPIGFEMKTYRFMDAKVALCVAKLGIVVKKHEFCIFSLHGCSYFPNFASIILMRLYKLFIY